VKPIAATLSLLCLSLVASSSFAQTPAPSTPRSTIMSLQDCQDRAAIKKGEKRDDGAVDKDVEKQCDDLLKAESKQAKKRDLRKDHEAAQTDNIRGANTTSTPMK
jgi:hypothetical protein